MRAKSRNTSGQAASSTTGVRISGNEGGCRMNGKLYVYALPYEDALKNGEEETYWESYHRNI